VYLSSSPVGVCDHLQVEDFLETIVETPKRFFLPRGAVLVELSDLVHGLHRRRNDAPVKFNIG
jgi:hypothetical protein